MAEYDVLFVQDQCASQASCYWKQHRRQTQRATFLYTRVESSKLVKILSVHWMLAGYFSLNVPSGLTLYWFTNNLLTTGQQVRFAHACCKS